MDTADRNVVDMELEKIEDAVEIEQWNEDILQSRNEDGDIEWMNADEKEQIETGEEQKDDDTEWMNADEKEETETEEDENDRVEALMKTIYSGCTGYTGMYRRQHKSEEIENDEERWNEETEESGNEEKSRRKRRKRKQRNKGRR